MSANLWSRFLPCLAGVLVLFFGGPGQAKTVDYLPNAEVAAKVAAAILEPLIGKDELAKKSPLIVESKGDIWAVYTHPEGGRKTRLHDFRSQFVIRLNKHTAAVVNWGVVQ